MYITILRLKVFAPPVVAVWRWCTVRQYSRSCLYQDEYVFRPSAASLRYRNKFSGRFLGDTGQKNPYMHCGGSCKSYIARQVVLPNQCVILRSYSVNEKKGTKIDCSAGTEPEDEMKKLGLVQKFKQMYKNYWYVLVPVHLVTSVGWFGGFYYLAKSGVDVVALLESMGVTQSIIEPLKDSSAGYIALAYAMYKIATPIRYTVTLGGTTISIKYLKEYGYIKPIPPKEKLKEMYQEKKDNLIERRDNLAVEFRQRRERFKECRETFMDEYRKRAKKSDADEKQL